MTVGTKGKLVKFYSTVSDRSEVVHMIAELFNKDGGPGSGNFGHKGRPGEVGGSGPGGGSGEAPAKTAETKKALSASPEEIKTARERAENNLYGNQYAFFSRYMRGIMYGQGDGHDAMNFYGFAGDVMMNNLLRGGVPRSHEQQVEWKMNLEKSRKSIDDLTKVIDGNELREPAVVFRGVKTYPGLAKMIGVKEEDGKKMQDLLNDEDFVKSLVGQTFSDPAFVSTSIDKEFPRKGGFASACEMEVICPEGTKGVYFGDQGRFTDEHEFLMQRGTQFVITSASVEQKKFSDEKRLMLTVSVVDQVPKEVPGSYTSPYPEEREEIRKAVESGEVMPQKRLEELFPKADPEVIAELNSIKQKEKRDLDDTYRIWELVYTQRELDMLSDIEAAELESYTMGLARYINSDSFRKQKKESDQKIDDISKGKLEGQKEAEEKVREKFPGVSGKAFAHIVMHQAEHDRVENLMKRDKERYGEEGAITKGRIRAIKEEERIMEYIAKKAG